MKTEKLNTEDIDNRLKQALESSDDFKMPGNLPELIFRKMEKRILLKQLLLEFFIKSVIALGSAGIFAGAFAWMGEKDFLEKYYLFAKSYGEPLLLLSLVSIIILLFDQIVLRYLSRSNPA